MNPLRSLFTLYLTMAVGVSLADNPPTASTTPLFETDGAITILVGKLPAIKMKKVNGGVFTMGATSAMSDGADTDELPTHKVRVSDFAIGMFEVTQELWVAVVGSNPCDANDDLQMPVYNVSWQQVQTFLQRLNNHPDVKNAGHVFRLPTEAEWEYAARGGSHSKGYRYAGGNRLRDVAWYIENSESDLHPVGTLEPNELGLHDMSGNVHEMVSDWYGADYYASFSSVPTDPRGPSTGSHRVARGGSWGDSPEKCRISYRATFDPQSTGFNVLGLRLAMSVN